MSLIKSQTLIGGCWAAHLLNLSESALLKAVRRHGKFDAGSPRLRKTTAGFICSRRNYFVEIGIDRNGAENEQKSFDARGVNL